MNSVTAIKNYILFLKKECNLDITLHPMGEEHLISTSELILFNIHENARCRFVKSFPHAQNHCVERQKKVVSKCKEGAFCGMCYAGVFEFVYPITDGESITGFISVSGYREKGNEAYAKRCSERFNIPIEELSQTSEYLKENIPDKSYIDTLVIPLLNMLELAYKKTTAEDTESTLTDKVIRYINRNYANNITVEEVSREFSCSRSNISHLFKKETGQNFREYITVVRLNAAKSLLKNSRLTITEIAFSVGFSDSNYFSNVFRKYEGVSPRKYRNK